MNGEEKQLIFPNKSDYPKSLSYLQKKDSSNLYRQLVESSASAYFETNFLTRYFFQKRFKIALELMPKNKRNMEILDAGCGIGFFLPTISYFAKHIWAVDYADHSLEYAKFMCRKKGLVGIDFKQVNLLEKLPFIKKKFDLIVCLSVLEHIKNLEKVANNFRKLLKRDGTLIAGYPNEDNFIFRLIQYIEKRIFRPKVFNTFAGTKLIHVSRAYQITRTLKKYFHIIETKKIELLPSINFYIIQKCSPI